MKGPQVSEMVAFQLAGLAFAAVAWGGFRWLALALCLAALATWLVEWRYSTTPRQQRNLFSLIGIPFSGLGLYYLTAARNSIESAHGVAITGATYVMLGAVVELYRHPDQARPGVFHVGGLTLLMVGGLDYSNPYYPHFLAAYGLATVTFLRAPYPGMQGQTPPPPSRAPRLGIVLSVLAAFGLAYFANSLIPGVGRSVYRLSFGSMVAGVTPTQGFFGATSDLSDIDALTSSRAISARVSGPPTRLRNQIYSAYSGGRWQNLSTREDRQLLEKGPLFTLPGSAPTRPLKWGIAPVKTAAGPLTVPAGIFQVEADIDELEVDGHDGLLADNRFPYTAVASGRVGKTRSAFAITSTDPRYLQLPERLRPLLVERATFLTGSPRQQAEQAEAYLQGGQYDAGARHSRRIDPVLDFLDKSLVGHCEYFASALALLLRSHDIPTRYVVGYRMQERNPWGGYYILRDRDAHAWVEVYLGEEGWVAFDPTPAAEHQQSHPEGNLTRGLEALWDTLKAYTGGFWYKLLQSRLGSISIAITAALLFLLVWVVFRFRHRLMAAWRALSPDETTPLKRLFAELERHLARQALTRQPSETPLELAERLKAEQPELARWLTDYNRCRFREAEGTDIERLEHSLKEFLS